VRALKIIVQAGAAALICLHLSGQNARLSDPKISRMYVPPAQMPVKATIADGVLMAEGSITVGKQTTGTRLFIVDSAATMTVVDARAARILGNQDADAVHIADETLRLAGAELSHRPAVVLPLEGWSQVTGQRVGGIVGWDVFEHLDAEIDYVHGHLRLVVPQSCALTPAQQTALVPLRVVGGLPFVYADIETSGGKQVRGLFLVDTGQSGPGIVLTSEFLAAHPEVIAGPAVEMPMMETSGAVRSTRTVRMPGLNLGGHVLQGVVATIALPAKGGVGAELAGVIGGGVLARFDVLVDLPHKSLGLRPNALFSAPFEVDMSGMLVVMTPAAGQADERSGQRDYVVTGIQKGSPAADAGLQIGDRLVEVAGQRVSEMSLDLVRNVLKSGPGTRVVVTIDRSGKRTMVTLTLRRSI